MSKSESKNSSKKTKKYHLELSVFSVILWSIFSFFLLTWIFVLGIMVGRGFLPGSVTTITDMRNQVRKLQDMVSHRDNIKPPAIKQEDDIPKLAFYEKLENKKDEVKKNRTQNNQSDSKKDMIPLPVESQIQKSEIVEKGSEDKIGPGQKTLSLIPETGYTVQIASIGDMAKAEEMIKELNGKGYDAYYYEAKVDGKYYYRIRCGRFSTRTEADVYAQKLKRESNLKGFVSKIE